MTIFLCAMEFRHLHILAITFGDKNVWPDLPFFYVTCISVADEYKGRRKWLMISEQSEICMLNLLGIFS